MPESGGRGKERVGGRLEGGVQADDPRNHLRLRRGQAGRRGGGRSALLASEAEARNTGPPADVRASLRYARYSVQVG
jgi:hypothetical protein